MFQVTTELASEHCAYFISISAEASRFTIHQLANIVDSISSVVNDIFFAYDRID